MAAKELSIRLKWENFIAEIPYFYLSLILWALALVCYWVPKIPYLTDHLPWLLGVTRPIGEALVVAGVLVLLIDPFLKQRLLKEACAEFFITYWDSTTGQKYRSA